VILREETTDGWSRVTDEDDSEIENKHNCKEQMPKNNEVQQL